MSSASSPYLPARFVSMYDRIGTPEQEIQGVEGRGDGDVDDDVAQTASSGELESTGDQPAEKRADRRADQTLESCETHRLGEK